VLVISGHWEAPEFTVQTHPHPGMVYDYGGFPEFTYRIQYPAPGSPEVAERVTELLDAADIPVRRDPQRGYDHGTFAPLYVMWPHADVPIVQLSLRSGYDPAAHLAAGRALAPLRDEGVLILGSGFSFHNLRLFGGGALAQSQEFDAWLTAAATDDDAERRVASLLDWERAPHARLAHPAEDHLVPLMVAVGAAEREAGVRVYHEPAFGGAIASSSYRFGDALRPQPLVTTA
jgi:aromatic ring-opening dioxygenase catalytic subunit (LigB family)